MPATPGTIYLNRHSRKRNARTAAKFAVREATPDEAEEYQKQLSENIDL